MDILLSFVIPAYNCGKYIDSCLESVLAQGLDEETYEIIVVNDGSTDDTEEKVKSFNSDHDNILLISTPNRGVGRARNEGASKARGRYVYFMDADDMLLPGGMKVLFDNYVTPEHFPDVVSFHSRTVDKYYDTKEWDIIRPHCMLFKGTLVAYADSYGVGNSVWTQLISRKLIEDGHLEFTDHKIGEDMLFMLCLYGMGNAMVLATNLNIYRYHVREESAMNNCLTENLLKAFESLMDLSCRLKAMKMNCKVPVIVLDEDIDICKRWAFTRLSSAPLSYSELRYNLNLANEKGLFCLGNNRSLLNRFMAVVSGSTLLFYVFSIAYRYFFLSFIKPYLKRN